MRFLLVGVAVLILLVAIWDKLGRENPQVELRPAVAAVETAPAPTETPLDAARSAAYAQEQAQRTVQAQQLLREQRQASSVQFIPPPANSQLPSARDLSVQIESLKSRLAEIEDAQTTLVNRAQAQKDAQAIEIVNRRENLENQIRSNIQEQENTKLQIQQYFVANPTPTPGFYPAPTVTPSTDLINLQNQLITLRNDERSLNSQLQNLKNEGERLSLSVSQQANLNQVDLQVERNSLLRELQEQQRRVEELQSSQLLDSNSQVR